MKGQAIRVIFGTSVGTACPNKGPRRLIIPVSRGCCYAPGSAEVVHTKAAKRESQPKMLDIPTLDILLPTR